MRAVSALIARGANSEEKCTEAFCEGRFKAQRLLDEAGLLACYMYVDLNPILLDSLNAYKYVWHEDGGTKMRSRIYILASIFLPIPDLWEPGQTATWTIRLIKYH